MGVEQALRTALEQKRGDAFQEQLDKFREFERRLESGGYTIQRETFSVPLMERVAVCRSRGGEQG